jgi:hypothetical protein
MDANRLARESINMLAKLNLFMVLKPVFIPPSVKKKRVNSRFPKKSATFNFDQIYLTKY